MKRFNPIHTFWMCAPSPIRTKLYEGLSLNKQTIIPYMNGDHGRLFSTEEVASEIRVPIEQVKEMYSEIVSEINPHIERILGK